MNYTLFSVILFCLLFGCKSVDKKTVSEEKEPSHWVGDIHFNSELDDTHFMLCDSTHIIHRRNGLKYPGGKTAIKKECLEKFNFQPNFEPFSGFVMVRFIINCQKEKGRYRAESLDFDFSLKDCPLALKEHLIAIVDELDSWEAAFEKDKDSDFSKYLNFKIKNGKIENILH